MIARLQIVALQPVSILYSFKTRNYFKKQEFVGGVFNFNVNFFYGIYQIYMCKLNDNSKCDIWLEYPISLNHEWKIGGDAGNSHLV